MGYVIISILAFALGVLVTLLIEHIRTVRKMNKK